MGAGRGPGGRTAGGGAARGGTDRVDELFATFVAEATHRERRRPPALTEYLRLREVSAGLHVLFTFSELTDEVTLPPVVRAHPAIAGLERRAANLVGWANDLLTHEKEVAEGDALNLVAVLQAADGCSPWEAIPRVIERHNAEMRAFVGEAAAVPAFGEGHDAAVARHVEVLRAWVAGHLAWGVDNGRYRPVDMS